MHPGCEELRGDCSAAQGRVQGSAGDKRGCSLLYGMGFQQGDILMLESAMLVVIWQISVGALAGASDVGGS